MRGAAAGRRQKQRPEPTLQAPAIRFYIYPSVSVGVRYFYAARFRTAHLFFIASLIRLRADADKWRFTPLFDWAGRPGPRFRPCKAVIAALRRSRSASSSSMIVAVSMLLLGDNECTQLYMREQSSGCGSHFATVLQYLAARFYHAKRTARSFQIAMSRSLGFGRTVGL